MTKERNSAMRFWILFATLVLSGILINVWQRAGEARVSRTELKKFPAQLGDWQQAGIDSRLDQASEDVLRADDYLLRSFSTTDGRTASFYVGYYATQRNGASFHSPLNCLPGAGWTLLDGGRINISPADGSAPFEANRYIVQNGNDRDVMIYWYQGRGRFVASEYWGKIYTVIDSVRRRRSDGAMVRVLVPARDSDEKAFKIAANLASLAAPQLPAFVPN
jgi:EpsI family protein